MLTHRKAYPSDLNDEQWKLIEARFHYEYTGIGRPPTEELREVVNAILYLERSGCQWNMLPHDLPPKSTVYDYFIRWQNDGTWNLVLTDLRDRIRRLKGRYKQPTTANIDSQAVKSSEHSQTRRFDGGKRITGRKRHLVVDSLGLILAVTVTAASVDDAVAAPQVMTQIQSTEQPRLKHVRADSKYHNHALYQWLKKQRNLRWDLEIVSRPKGSQGFIKLPKRWVVERTFSWLNRWRRLSWDCEHYEQTSETMIKVASIGRMLRYVFPSESQPQFKYRRKDNV